MIALRSACLLALLALPNPALGDVLVDNINGITIGQDGDIDRFTGLWIDDGGRIRQVLDDGDERPLETDFYYDGEGLTVLPGMIDSHVHVISLGLSEMVLDLRDTRSLDEALEKIARFAADNPSRPWIIGQGWNHELWGLGRFPSAAELDNIVPDRPVWLERIDGHAGWANSKAMDLAGVTPGTKDPEGGRIERVGKSLVPMGVFVDKASALITTVVPPPRPAERDAALQNAQKRLLSLGVTAVADMGTSIEDWHTFRRAGDRGELKLRIMAYSGDADAMEMIGGATERPWLYDNRLRLNGLKVFLDGALGSRGAWLKQPYADDPGTTGLPAMSGARLRNLMSRATLGGYQVAVHSIGDAANAEVLGAIEELAASFPGDRRWRIEHVQHVDPDDISRLGQLGIIASMQPLHMSSDRLMAEKRLGPDRLAGSYAWRSILDAGGTLAFGSDAPVEVPDPFAAMAVAVSRRDATGAPDGGWLPDETIGLAEVLAAYTADAAKAGFADGRFGRLIAGESADFVIIDRDPFTTSAAQIRETKVHETWIGGEPAFRAGN